QENLRRAFLEGSVLPRLSWTDPRRGENATSSLQMQSGFQWHHAPTPPNLDPLKFALPNLEEHGKHRELGNDQTCNPGPGPENKHAWNSDQERYPQHSKI